MCNSIHLLHIHGGQHSFLQSANLLCMGIFLLVPYTYVGCVLTFITKVGNFLPDHWNEYIMYLIIMLILCETVAAKNYALQLCSYAFCKVYLELLKT